MAKRIRHKGPRRLAAEQMVARVGKRIEDLRQKRDWGQGDLSHNSEIDVVSIWRMENGTTEEPSLRAILQLANALDCTVSELLGEVPTDDAEAREVLRLVKGLEGVDGKLLLSNLTKIDKELLGVLDTFVTGWLANKG